MACCIQLVFEGNFLCKNEKCGLQSIFSASILIVAFDSFMEFVRFLEVWCANIANVLQDEITPVTLIVFSRSLDMKKE